ncbi:MAG: hypothetical protein ACRCV0_05260 [Brevinema sp.]
MAKFFLLFAFIVFQELYAQEENIQELSPKEQKIQQEIADVSLPKLPKEEKDLAVDVPEKLQINASTEAVKKEKSIPNKGNPYFTFSGGLSPYQAGIGILKYFIPEWWGHLELNLSFFPTIPVENYYTVSRYSPFVAFKIITGYSFYSMQFFEMSLFLQVQFAFVSTTDIPFILSLGFRFMFPVIWIDLGASYSVSTTGIESKVFKGFHPTISVGFRF